MISTRTKAKVIKEVQVHDKDTGSADVQVAVISKRIEELTSHLKGHPKDNHSRRGLIGMVSKRRKLLSYLMTNSPKRHGSLVKKLGLKK
ncbi:MAG: 30S ribosomal protein S15 [Candidatus Colwellbacteria bacterium RIFCSPLOWO2_01_FULL_48_10]|uniref:Small ribosomal subunit protein uS15 n=1 Tax=Candidatus Colwellbacteria bacterium RIFCSPLOWO2_01_FULL_48_10 TaxID=1797690 RepID=A0A1G1Z9T2_9BACT|nr:MAG: 30S ribosomal protein S15 [Candidatus Colwellbacteria bacterium RIFCSPLOWO2_01_FULL_48_10]